MTTIYNRQYFNPLGGLIQEYQDRIFIDDSLTDQDVLLLSVFTCDHHSKATGTLYKILKDTFLALGRKEGNFRVALSNAAKTKLIDYKQKDKIILLNLTGLKRVREILGQSENTTVYVVKSGEKFSSIKIFEEFLSKEASEPKIFLCDSHISDKTLFPFSVLGGTLKELRILTANIYDTPKFTDYKNRLHTEFDIIVTEKINTKIHDRYLLSGKSAWMIGTSIKDLGNKDSIIKQVDELYDSLKDVFDLRWSEP